MPAVFHNTDDVAIVDQRWIARVKEGARKEPLRRARLNLHHSEKDQVQEMLIAFCKDSLVYPHRHHGKSESLHAVEGRILVVFFDDDGRELRRVCIGPPGSGLSTLYRLSSPIWHIVIPLDDIAVIHETTAGPFHRETEPIPSWAPRDEAALRAFIATLVQNYQNNSINNSILQTADPALSQ